jgi:hypothetical protein
MASKRQPIHTFAVFIDWSSDTTTMHYHGESEYKAVMQFYRCIRAASHDRRIDQVSLHRDCKPVAQVTVRTMAIA